MNKKVVTFDVECYVNYFLLTIMDVDSKVVLHEFEMYNGIRSDDHSTADVLSALQRYTLISFNGTKYDMLMITAYVAGADNYQLKTLTQDIIPGGGKLGIMPWDFERRYNTPLLKLDHIDLIEIAPGMHSLKVYGARLRSKLLQELPIHFNDLIMPHQTKLLRQYCINDNIVTVGLYDNLKGAIELRIEMGKEYGLDLRSKSDAQIGETIIIHEAEKELGQKLKKPHTPTMVKSFAYKSPEFVFFESDELKELLALAESLTYELSPKHKLVLHKEISKQVKVGNRKYKLGIGGLHSIGDSGSHYSDDEYEKLQIDVGSFYPNIILQGEFYPPQMGKDTFLRVYRSLVMRRNTAKATLPELDVRKANGEDVQHLIDKAKVIIGSVKIVLNGFYGKLGSHYSKAFAPGMLLNVTLTGQLSMLMLIEQLEKMGVEILSSNTDGITVNVKRTDRVHMDKVVDWWCEVTGFTMDYDLYKSVHYRDINNYFTHYQDGSIAGIGIFAKESLRISPEYFIIRDACFAWVTDGVTVENSINECDDIHQFINVRKVTGGATKDGEDIGSAIRWYHSMDTNTPILYKKPNKTGNFNKVAGSTNGMPCMDYPNEMPVDLDRNFYTNKTYCTLAMVGLLHEGLNYYRITDITGVARVDPTFSEEYRISRDEFFDIIGITNADIKKYSIK